MNTSSPVSLAREWVEKKQYDKALDCIEAISDLEFDGEIGHIRGVCLTSMGRATEADEVFKTLLLSFPDQIEYQTSYLTTLLANFELDEAIRLSNAILEKDPNNVTTYFFAGVIYFGLTEFEQAEPYFKKACELQPDNIVHLTQLARCYMGLGRFEEAVPLFDQSFQLEPKFIETIVYGAQAHLAIGNFDSAILYLESGLKNFPTNQTIIDQLSLLYIEIDQPKKSAKILKKAVKMFPERAEYKYQLALTMIQANEINRAIQFIEPLIENPNHKSVVLVCLYGLAHQLSDQFDVAESLFDDAIAMASTDPLPYLYKSTLLFKKGDYTESIHNADIALKYNPELADAHFRKAECLRQLNDPFADDSYRTAIQLSPNNEMYQYMYQNPNH